MHFYDRLRGKLGVARIRSDRDLVSLVEKQPPATVIQWLVRGGLSDGGAGIRRFRTSMAMAAETKKPF